jgi:quinol monooxygenase YgiN
MDGPGRMKLVVSVFAPIASSPLPMNNNSTFLSHCRRQFSNTTLMSKPVSVIVQAEIDPSRMDEFLPMIKNNGENSRKEPGCIRFGKYLSDVQWYLAISLFIASHFQKDVLRAQDNPNKFWFYEVYENTADVDFHKTQAHYTKHGPTSRKTEGL